MTNTIYPVYTSVQNPLYCSPPEAIIGDGDRKSCARTHDMGQFFYF